MKEKVRQNLLKERRVVTDFYKEEGVYQFIARSNIFDKATLSVIAFNAIWIMIDTDYNDVPVLLDAHPVFIIAENFFCTYFFFEWFVRMMSFRRKLDGLKDAWFCFDSVMVCMMVLETWIFMIVLAVARPTPGTENGNSEGGDMGIIRLARLLRLSRMARMGKLLRVMPELMIMIKGMLAATRSVCFTLGLLMIIMYVFAIAFVQLTADYPTLSANYFTNVPKAIYTLLIGGIFLDGVGSLTKVLAPHFHLAAMFYLFVLIGSLTVLNMLIGVLCEVVSAVAATEQEEMLVNYVHEKLSHVMSLLDSDGGGTISKREFMEILENVEAVRCLNDVGIDVFALVDLAEYIFQDDDAKNQDDIELDFANFMEIVLELRGTNTATVRDIVGLRKFMRLSMAENYRQTSEILQRLDTQMQTLQEEQELLGSFTHHPDGWEFVKKVPLSDLPPVNGHAKAAHSSLDGSGLEKCLEDPLPMPPQATPWGGLMLSVHPTVEEPGGEPAPSGERVPLYSSRGACAPLQDVGVADEADTSPIATTPLHGSTEDRGSGHGLQARPCLGAPGTSPLASGRRPGNGEASLAEAELQALKVQISSMCKELSTRLDALLPSAAAGRPAQTPQSAATLSSPSSLSMERRWAPDRGNGGALGDKMARPSGNGSAGDSGVPLPTRENAAELRPPCSAPSQTPARDRI
eukprot:TRINITY_DN8907_c1_g6_i1.p1 TRINITY_DN8907_c1_g6~~TRINITY_DN8907_c1_g6_i1.p1  ORF type:complete len:774 (+),score=213.81 TRINITY_DN8907_c1_g6_i1:258-2324(+)